jgi:hypothetical protein
MKIIERTKELIETVKIHLKNEHLHEDVSYTSFWLSLLPIPGFQQLNQVIDRISSNKALKIRLENIWSEIKSTNDTIENIENDIEKLQEIGGTVNFNKKIKKQVAQIINDITQDLKLDNDTEWIMETENWSYQEVLNSFVESDFAAIIAKNNSTNVVENTEIKAKKTNLHAKDGSKNFINKTKFSSSDGSVGMNGITTKGNVAVSGSGIGLEAGSSLIFGGNPNLVSANCPFCKTKIEVDKRELVGYTSLKCPNTTCGKILNF